MPVDSLSFDMFIIYHNILIISGLKNNIKKFIDYNFYYNGSNEKSYQMFTLSHSASDLKFLPESNRALFEIREQLWGCWSDVIQPIVKTYYESDNKCKIVIEFKTLNGTINNWLNTVYHKYPWFNFDYYSCDTYGNVHREMHICNGVVTVKNYKLSDNITFWDDTYSSDVYCFEYPYDASKNKWCPNVLVVNGNKEDVWTFNYIYFKYLQSHIYVHYRLERIVEAIENNQLYSNDIWWIWYCVDRPIIKLNDGGTKLVAKFDSSDSIYKWLNNIVVPYPNLSFDYQVCDPLSNKHCEIHANNGTINSVIEGFLDSNINKWDKYFIED